MTNFLFYSLVFVNWNGENFKTGPNAVAAGQRFACNKSSNIVYCSLYCYYLCKRKEVKEFQCFHWSTPTSILKPMSLEPCLCHVAFTPERATCWGRSRCLWIFEFSSWGLRAVFPEAVTELLPFVLSTVDIFWSFRNTFTSRICSHLFLSWVKDHIQ